MKVGSAQTYLSFGKEGDITLNDNNISTLMHNALSPHFQSGNAGSKTGRHGCLVVNDLKRDLKQCQQDGCESLPMYGQGGATVGQYCYKHRERGMVFINIPF
mmetsp:Transcript_50982/g.87709  ORF Transcript_50982/g.87709 Transcript_50982/m.87709 type:complete len:102 (+) Transcript_50982:622-927(+)